MNVDKDILQILRTRNSDRQLILDIVNDIDNIRAMAEQALDNGRESRALVYYGRLSEKLLVLRKLLNEIPPTSNDRFLDEDKNE